MTEGVAISISDVSLNYPLNNKGIGLLREILTGRVKKESTRLFRALEKISLDVKKGEVVGLMGANGSGKSTLLRVIAGIYAPDEGSVKVRGRVTLLAGIGTGFQYDLTGRENILLTGSIYGYSKKEISNMEEEIIEFSGVREFIDQPIRTYSAGMRARLGFAIVSNLEPDILLLDEVMSVGDTDFRQKSRNKIEQLIKGDATVVIVSHSKSIIKSMCDRVFAIDDGKIITDGSIDTALEYYESIGK
ncbi:MAG TPA: ABC transporter ATP-binding protein [Candidatus Poseidoniaceae archaeon]|nr:MAG TPA: ABC transporter ATP-binding protein [Candidatus Poseidoniales archaeon]HII37100.1 ABC transporter ATP-binding protein [Candidatus Poseidoniaceae archaeon]|tara:strand:+ start:1037 stop:1774 length:738 start_codon:yes stop_codon:yes gene_type:complete